YGVHSPFGQRLLNRHTHYNHQIEKLRQWEQEQKAFVIRPSKPILIGKLERDPAKLQAVYDIGTQDAKAALEGLKQYLNQ
ncbi:MAG: hypothetical protein HUJ55_06215, partial [Ileibacterium sp.]|nr:hypothetical protein [Ileibacterium sp.]